MISSEFIFSFIVLSAFFGFVLYSAAEINQTVISLSEKFQEKSVAFSCTAISNYFYSSPGEFIEDFNCFSLNNNSLIEESFFYIAEEGGVLFVSSSPHYQ